MMVVKICFMIIDIVSNVHLTDFRLTLVLAPFVEHESAVVVPEHPSHPIQVFIFDPRSVFINGKCANFSKSGLPHWLLQCILDCVAQTDSPLRVSFPKSENVTNPISVMAYIISDNRFLYYVVELSLGSPWYIPLTMDFLVQLLNLIIVNLSVIINFAVGLLNLI